MPMHSESTLYANIWKCEKCKRLGVLRDERQGLVPLCFEGNPSSEFWIIGLNPKNMSEEELSNYNADSFADYYQHHLDYSFEYRYFTSMQLILDRINQKTSKHYVFGKNVMSTDLVKCASPNWNTTNTGKKLNAKEKRELIANCSEWLWKQIRHHKPRYVLCNGIQISKAVYNYFKKEKDPEFSPSSIDTAVHRFSVDNHMITIILSGFINRLDGITKLRITNDIIFDIKIP